MIDTALTAIQFLVAQAIEADTDAASRIYFSQAPQGAAFPFVVIDIVSRTETPTQDSGSAVDTYRFQVDVWARATSSVSAFAIASGISTDLREVWSRQTDTYIDGIQEVNFFTDYDGELLAQRVSNDYMVRVKPDGTGMSIVTSGTYTPTVESEANFTTIEVHEGQYLRVGNTVTVSGQFNGTANEIGDVEIQLTLPVVTGMSATEDAAGIVSDGEASGKIECEDPDHVRLIWTAVQNSISTRYSYHFTYQII
jgi:hypothetical protein